MSTSDVPTIPELVGRFITASEHADLLRRVLCDLIDNPKLGGIGPEPLQRLAGVSCALEHLAAVLAHHANDLDASNAEIVVREEA